jgi:hypothetical protein
MFEYYLVFDITIFVQDPFSSEQNMTSIAYSEFAKINTPTLTKEKIIAFSKIIHKKFMSDKYFLKKGLFDCQVTLINWLCLGKIEKDNESKTN